MLVLWLTAMRFASAASFQLMTLQPQVVGAPPAKPSPAPPTASAPPPAVAAPAGTGQDRPIVYGRPATGEPEDPSADQKQQQMQQLIQSLGGMAGGGGAGAGGAAAAPSAGGAGGSGGGGSGGGGTFAPASRQGRSASGQGGSYVATGRLDSCAGQAPAYIEEARQRTLRFRSKCAAANRGDNQKIVINDYSCNGTPTMWIFDMKGTCIAKTAIAYGVKGESGGCPTACATSGSNATPPGFHLTGYHPDGGNGYGPDNSMELVGLQGQLSNNSKRGILIHGAWQPGTATTLGCTGVCKACYGQVRELLGFGALVYNNFGTPPAMADGCGNSAGASVDGPCRLDRAMPELNGGKPGAASSGDGPDTPRSGR